MDTVGVLVAERDRSSPRDQTNTQKVFLRSTRTVEAIGEILVQVETELFRVF